MSLSQEVYSVKMLEKFNMNDCKPVSVPLGKNFKLSVNQSPNNEEEKSEMSNIPYASAVGSQMYLMVCTRPDLARHECGEQIYGQPWKGTLAGG